MADEATQNADSKPGEGEQQETGEDQRIPYARFEEVNKRAKKYEQELNALREQLQAHEDQGKSEVERERAARARAEQQVASLSSKITNLEKGSWVRSAATELNFHDPEDAVQHLRDQLGSMEDQADAKRLVRNLAKGKKHLVREEKKDERPSISRMFAGDQAAQQNGGGQQMSPAQRARQQEADFAQGLANELSKFVR